MAILSSEMNAPHPPSAIGFEGYEKRLEISFSEAPLFVDPQGSGLRALSRAQIDSILSAARCEIVDHLSNDKFDSYVLSESSLFVYPLKIILKTCGTTKLLQSIQPTLDLAATLSLNVSAVKYSRGSFIFPNAQPAPHRSFSEEVQVLNGYFGGLASGGEAYVIGDPLVSNRQWHIYFAANENPQPNSVTLEMCMTDLDRERASIFYKNSDMAMKRMTMEAGIQDILPGFEICDFEFEPCGYSMNAIEGRAFSTIHVTPEDGFSYASYEAMGLDPFSVDCCALVERALRCFGPSEFSVAITSFGPAGKWGRDLVLEGYSCEEVGKQNLPGGGVISFLCFSKKTGGVAHGSAMSPKSILHKCWDDEEVGDGCVGADMDGGDYVEGSESDYEEGGQCLCVMSLA
ncbi:S-adenosylmethionine decarboxylase proenzyme-like protein [Cinnamomum micranthum f. kanehirae]|uniref:adenosylmethionine decarboxylase n=1 Tax=Cinnamomum micranthum f. kanehirae TaxID=337451 RepID=A0A443NA32_9MAGN|nr:S-adenosylmethionine decarboxylase proenzyme-like protein [Cinnamomum micranthum f. kanehirae]